MDGMPESIASGATASGDVVTGFSVVVPIGVIAGVIAGVIVTARCAAVVTMKGTLVVGTGVSTDDN